MLQCKAKAAAVGVMLVVLSILASGQAFGESVMIKRKFDAGRVSYIENKVEIDQKISGLPMPDMKFRIVQLFGLLEKVESIGGGKAKIVLTFDRAMRSVESSLMGTSEFDTDDPEHEEAAPQLGVVLEPMIGMPLTMEVDRDGELVSFAGMEAINKKVSEQAVASMHWEQMKSEFTDELGKETWGREPLLIYPNKEVEVGDTWKASSEIARPPFGTFVTGYRYTLDRIAVEDGRKTAVIKVEGVVSGRSDSETSTEAEERGTAPKGDKENDSAEGDGKKASPEVEVRGAISGTALYDVALGRVVRETTQGEMDITIALSRLNPALEGLGESEFATFKFTFDGMTRVLTEEARNRQKAEARRRAELRRMAEEEDEEDEGDD